MPAPSLLRVDAVLVRPVPRRVGLLPPVPDPTEEEPRPDQLLVDQVGAAVPESVSVSASAAGGAMPQVSQ
jgi:hypothetical protein